MSHRTSQRRPLNRSRRIVAWTVLTLQSILTTGLPIPGYAAEVNDGTPYPCRDHRCGCASAMQCWKQCCCFTNAQKVAWAEEHGVKLPDFVVAAAKAEQRSTPSARSTPAQSTRSCCSKRRTCCETASSQLHESHDCSQDHSEPRPSESGAADSLVISASTKDRRADSMVFVSLIEAQRCGGQPPECLGMAVSLPPPPPVRLNSTIDLIRPFFFPSRPAWTSTSFSPPVPPPRAA